MPYKDFIIPDPECYHSEIQDDDDVLILCSDGLLLVYTEEQLAKDISEKRSEYCDLGEIAKKITDECCTNYNCRDNVSLILVDLKKHREEHMEQQQRTNVMASPVRNVSRNLKPETSPSLLP